MAARTMAAVFSGRKLSCSPLSASVNNTSLFRRYRSPRQCCAQKAMYARQSGCGCADIRKRAALFAPHLQNAPKAPLNIRIHHAFKFFGNPFTAQRGDFSAVDKNGGGGMFSGTRQADADIRM